ncbi:sigma-70 family RNA polymerase sigma factor [Treponema pedis]|uniref:sigma-70 family RNA polymerase sigma factor n=1 Tax=Treponema pedis TaxID=409322 RepID=UPI0003FDFBBA|nr:RNA polymerase sigma factor RpoD/SigA [Treponema pedis]
MVDDVLLQYIKDAKKYPLLTAEEEIVLADAAKKGDYAAFEKLITSNLRLVIKMAKRYSKNNSVVMELIQEGNIGLIKAAKKFSKAFNVRFSSYAVWWIKQSFSRYLNSHERIIKLPVRKEFLMRQMKNEEEKYEINHGIKPSDEELSKLINESESSVMQLKNLIARDICSLDAPVQEDGNSCMYDIIACNTYNPEEEAINKEFRLQLNKCMGVLTDREKDIIKKRYGLNGINEKLSFAFLGSRYSVSAESIRQIQLKALRKLRTQKNVIRSMAVYQ